MKDSITEYIEDPVWFLKTNLKKSPLPDEALVGLKKMGNNIIQADNDQYPIKILTALFINLKVYLLIIASDLSFWLKVFFDAVVILIVTLIITGYMRCNLSIGFLHTAIQNWASSSTTRGSRQYGIDFHCIEPFIVNTIEKIKVGSGCQPF